MWYLRQAFERLSSQVLKWDEWVRCGVDVMTASVLCMSRDLSILLVHIAN